MISIIEESDKANRYYWILEYIDLDRTDPVHVVQNRTKAGNYHKKKGSRYDSNDNSEGSLFDLLSPQQSDPSLPTSPDQNDGWKVVGKPARSSHHSPSRNEHDNHHRSFSKNTNSSSSINSHSSLRRVNSFRENANALPCSYIYPPQKSRAVDSCSESQNMEVCFGPISLCSTSKETELYLK